MKKNRIIYILSFIIILATSCSKKFLEDMKPYDKYSDASLFTSETQMDWYISNVYYTYFNAYKQPTATVSGLYNDTRTTYTEEIGGTINNTYLDPAMTYGDATQADGYFGSVLTSSIQNEPYSRIRSVNFILERIDVDGAATMSEAFRKTAKGQAYFFRGLQYFDLLRTYGGVPLVTKMQLASASDESIKIPRNTVSECVAQITADFDSAANLLPAVWDNPGANYGRFTKVGALAMKSRVLLTFASPLFNPNWDNAGDTRWDAALQAGLAAKQAADAAGYGLYGTTAKDWSEMTWKNDNSFNKEALIIKLLSNNSANTSTYSYNGWEKRVRPSSQTGSGGISAPKEMIDMFPMADGSRPVTGTGGNYVDTFFFMNRDPRFYRTFAFSGCKWAASDATTDAVVWFYRWKNGTKIGTSGNNNVSSPAVVRKMSNTTVAKSAFATSGTDIFEYRYTELLLNIAECYAAKGDVANSLLYLGQIRQRVGIPSANNYGIGTPADKYAAIDDCLYERRVELAYEGKRFWDIQRWMLYTDDLLHTGKKINGTNRSGYYWQCQTASDTDPLTSTDKAISIDPDAADFLTQLDKLKTLYQNKLVKTPLDVPMDKNSNNVEIYIKWPTNCYLSGLNSAVLTNNSWMLQNNDWRDQNGATGTFDARK